MGWEPVGVNSPVPLGSVSTSESTSSPSTWSSLVSRLSMMLLMSAASFFSVDVAAWLSALRDISGACAQEPRGAGERRGKAVTIPSATQCWRKPLAMHGHPFLYPYSSQLSPSYTSNAKCSVLKLQIIALPGTIPDLIHLALNFPGQAGWRKSSLRKSVGVFATCSSFEWSSDGNSQYY